jgi:hypothetical protein
MLGSRSIQVDPVVALLVALEDNWAACLPVHPNQTATPEHRTRGNESNQEPLENRISIQERLLSDRTHGGQLEGKQGVLQNVKSTLRCERTVNSLVRRDAPVGADRRQSRCWGGGDSRRPASGAAGEHAEEQGCNGSHANRDVGPLTSCTCTNDLRLPNGSRLSCGALLEHSQTQFYHRRRAPAASSAC